jgi:hypothetical protein
MFTAHIISETDHHPLHATCIWKGTIIRGHNGVMRRSQVGRRLAGVFIAAEVAVMFTCSDDGEGDADADRLLSGGEKLSKQEAGS